MQLSNSDIKYTI